jgi:poly(3-hydroxybutyrate) depolymerase
MLRLHGDLVARGRIARTTPVFAMGMSNGGGFASVFAATASRKGLNVRGVADYMGPIPQAALAAPGALADFPPVFVVQAVADGLVDPTRVAQVVEALKVAGVRTEYHLVQPQPLTAGALAELLDIPTPKAADLVAELQQAGVLDASGHVVGAGTPLDRQAMANLEQRLPPSAKGREVLNALVIAAAGHQMRSDYAEAQAAFFEAALARPKRP